jgi:hypothetical protein
LAPQPPQLFGSLVSSTQPTAGQQVSAPVHAGPPLHVAWHMLSAQTSPGGHMVPQPPQLLASLVVSVQPIEQHWRLPVHAGPPLHVAWHMDITQLDPGMHAMPQPPQLFESEVSSTHVVPQQLCPPGHPAVWQVVGWQTPETQGDPDGQACPQKPQLLGSLVVSISQPSATWPSQLAKPGEQLEISQVLIAQVVVPLGTGCGQTMPQPPQLWGSAVVFAHRRSQHTSLPGHVTPTPQAPTHSPPEQTCMSPQACPQPPQLFGSLAVSTSQPSVTWSSQLAKGGAHAPMPQVDPAQMAVAWGNGPQTTPHCPQFSALVIVSTQSGVQQVSPSVQAWPPPQKPTHTKSEHSCPSGHWLSVVHCTQVCVSSRQCGVGAEQS